MQAEELRKAILAALDEKLPGRRSRGRSRNELRAAAEAIQYEDWAVDFNMVRCSWLLFHLSISGLKQLERGFGFSETCTL